MASTDLWNFSVYFVFPMSTMWLSKPTTFELYSFLMGPELLVSFWAFFPSTFHVGFVPIAGSVIFFLSWLSCLPPQLTVVGHGLLTINVYATCPSIPCLQGMAGIVLVYNLVKKDLLLKVRGSDEPSLPLHNNLRAWYCGAPRAPIN